LSFFPAASAADYDCDGNLDIAKTNFAGDTASLYRNQGKMVFDDQTFQAGLGKKRWEAGGDCRAVCLGTGQPTAH